MFSRRAECGRIAQLGEHRVRNAGVEGSNPFPSTKSTFKFHFTADALRVCGCQPRFPLRRCSPETDTAEVGKVGHFEGVWVDFAGSGERKGSPTGPVEHTNTLCLAEILPDGNG